MIKNEYERRFTDAEYLSKKEIAERVGVALAETVWRITDDYREKFRFPLEIKRFDKFPFSIVIPPSVMALANTAERYMLKYSLLFENYKLRESISDNKSLSAFKHEIIRDDLLLIAHSQEIVISERDIDMMLKPENFHMRNSVMHGYYSAVELLKENSNSGVNMALIRDLYNRINNSDNTSLFYRTSDQLSSARGAINEFEGTSGTNAKIAEHMNMLIDFYASDYEMSPFIIGAIIFTYFLYVSPFERHNLYVAILLLLKIIADAGYGECVYYTSMTQFIIQRYDELKVIFDEVKRCGDLTYAITFICKQFIEALNWKERSLQKVEMPKPYMEEVKIIEKPIEVIKEVVKEVQVPVEKVVEKIVEKIVYRDVEKPVVVTPEIKEEIKEDKVEDDYEDDYLEEEDYTYSEEVKKVLTTSQYEYDEKDPFATVPISKLNLDEPRIKRPTYNEDVVYEEPTPLEKTPEPLKKEVQVRTMNSEIEKIENLDSLKGLENDNFARALVELYPHIKYTQALFYARHRSVGRYYTIGQFKDFLDCAYETARTSMEFLTSIGLYNKEQLKNKFVYTPVNFDKNEE